jgi:uncharacterized protein YgiM (DUF1202 family)
MFLAKRVTSHFSRETSFPDHESVYNINSQNKEAEMISKIGKLTGCCLVLILMISGCGGGGNPETPTSSSSSPTVTVSPSKTPTPTPTPKPSPTSVKKFVTEDEVRFRAAPSLTATIFQTFMKGTEVMALQVEGDWTKVVFETSTGYIYNKYLSDLPPTP